MKHEPNHQLCDFCMCNVSVSKDHKNASCWPVRFRKCPTNWGNKKHRIIPELGSLTCHVCSQGIFKYNKWMNWVHWTNLRDLNHGWWITISEPELLNSCIGLSRNIGTSKFSCLELPPFQQQHNFGVVLPVFKQIFSYCSFKFPYLHYIPRIGIKWLNPQ